LPVNFIGGPDTIVEQIKQCRDQVGAGVIDLMFQTPASSDPVDALMQRLELFGEKILSRIRDI
jgi:alkanesulfonate monooxygenase SsuD/methylene tetrahydromethanopterin reductase-like flavin-dependent oxidoreductase (luciferase family)